MSDSNTGDSNTGDYNTGNHNTGFYNTGNHNTGFYNTGNHNTGDSNTGYYNTGDSNTGFYNTGDSNTGDYNTGNHNTGFFCTETPHTVFFDKPTPMTWDEATRLIPCVNLPCGAEWVPCARMTPGEVAENPNAQRIGGYLRKHDLPLCESFPVAWSKMDSAERQRWLDLPNFDAAKFYAITGVDVREPEAHTIVVDGIEISLSHQSWLEIKKAIGQVI